MERAIVKMLGLDLGDAWVGIAISDAFPMFARPLETVATAQLSKALKKIFESERISTVVVGYPKTMAGTRSQQTIKVEQEKERLAKEFPSYTWVLWDERLSSKRAEELNQAHTKQEKLHNHSVAAAFILQSYLDYMSMQTSNR